MFDICFGLCVACIGLSILGVAIAAALSEWRISIRSAAHDKGYREGKEETERYIRSDAVNRGLAFYHPQTGSFTWNPAQPKPEIKTVAPPAKKAGKR